MELNVKFKVFLGLNLHSLLTYLALQITNYYSLLQVEIVL